MELLLTVCVPVLLKGAFKPRRLCGKRISKV
jgi:hypothetical protein